MQTKIECINKQLLVDANWANKAIWKSVLKQQKMFCYSGNQFKRHGQVHEIVTYKIFVTHNSSRKHKILIFFPVVNWGSMGRVVTQTRGQAFNHSDQLFKHLGKLFKLSAKLLVFS